MRVLLLGEFSSLYLNLKEGLEALGCEVVTVSAGDGYKKVPADVDLNSALPGILGKIHRKIKPYLDITKYSGFDVVQVINPFIFYHALLPNLSFFKYLVKNNNKIFLSAAGDDSYFWKYGRAKLEYAPFDDFLKYDHKSPSYFLEDKKLLDLNKNILGLMNGVIPIMYEYEVSYKHENKCLGVIPIPINLDKVKYEKNIVGEKLVIFHGLNRYGFKGTHYVEKAFSYLQEKYPDDLELIIDGGMSLDKYLKVLAKTNVVIDQMNSHSLGVNGIYSLAMGKVVIGGAEEIALKAQNVQQSPVINVKPSSEDLIRVIEELLQKRSEIESLGLSSREYAEDVHCHIKVAKQYLETWEKN